MQLVAQLEFESSWSDYQISHSLFWMLPVWETDLGSVITGFKLLIYITIKQNTSFITTQAYPQHDYLKKSLLVKAIPDQTASGRAFTKAKAG